MARMLRTAVVVAALVTVVPRSGEAQTFEAAGSRAAGMGGAFVAIADDASAVYWNPAGLAHGSFFSLVLDRASDEASPDTLATAGSQSATLAALAFPAVGLSYYRLRATHVRSDGNLLLDGASVSSLVTHHAGVTLVQSLTNSIAVGTTLKFVRGIAASSIVFGADSDDALDQADDLIGTAHNRFDADIGVMGVFGTLRTGLTVRNVRELSFETPDGADTLRMDRQVRAGAALTLATNLLVSADVDLTRSQGHLGDVRDLAAGGEYRISPRAVARAGFRVNTIGDQPAGRAASGTAGGSVAVYGSLLIDGHVTLGGDESARGWGVGARMVF